MRGYVKQSLTEICKSRFEIFYILEIRFLWDKASSWGLKEASISASLWCFLVQYFRDVLNWVAPFYQILQGQISESGLLALPVLNWYTLEYGRN